MFNKKHFLLGFLLVVLFSIAATEELTIKNLERQVLLNGPYPLEQVYVEFRSEDNVNVFKHIVPAQL